MIPSLPEPTTQYHRAAEDLLARLRLVFGVGMFEVRLMPPAPSRAEWQRITATRPFVGLAFAGFKPRPQTRALMGASEWIVYLVVDNASDVAGRWTGDSRGVGLWGMITAAGRVLHGATIEGVGSVAVTEISSLYREDWADEATAIAAIGVEIDMAPGAGFAAGVETLDDFLRLTCAWVQPSPEGSAPLPTDTITLRG